MPLRSFNPCFGLSRRTGAIVLSCFLVALALVFTVSCFAQLGVVRPMLRDNVRAAFAIASILQVVLVALGTTIIFASWKESPWLICFSGYLIVTHLAFNIIVLVYLLVAVAPIGPCRGGPRPCSKLVVTTPVWDALSAVILFAQLYLSLVVFSYFIYLQDHSRRPYMPEIASRSLSAPPHMKLDHKRLLSNSEPYQTVELGAVESGTTTRSTPTPEPVTGYGGGMRTYVEAEQNEKERLRREMENEGNQAVSFPVPSTSETGILTPLGLQWRDGDLPPYVS